MFGGNSWPSLTSRYRILQSWTKVPAPDGIGYMMDVSSDANSIGYGPWVNICGFSASALKWMVEYEQGLS